MVRRSIAQLIALFLLTCSALAGRQPVEWQDPTPHTARVVTVEMAYSSRYWTARLTTSCHHSRKGCLGRVGEPSLLMTDM
jgi:hypothetical protein